MAQISTSNYNPRYWRYQGRVLKAWKVVHLKPSNLGGGSYQQISTGNYNPRHWRYLHSIGSWRLGKWLISINLKTILIQLPKLLITLVLVHQGVPDRVLSLLLNQLRYFTQIRENLGRWIHFPFQTSEISVRNFTLQSYQDLNFTKPGV